MSIKIKLSCSLLAISLVLPFLSHASDPFAGLPDPTRHKQTAKKVVKKVAHKPLVLQSTLISEDRSYAIINGKSVEIGERVNGATLLTINPFDVTVKRYGRRLTLRLMPTDIVRNSERSTNED
jgi:hypothetical protein